MTSKNVSEQEIEIFVASPIRMAFLMTHYRQPLDWTDKRITDAAKILKRFLRVAVPNNKPPPVEVLEALMDDLNTPKAIAAMHAYRSKGRGEELFSAMRFLGLVSFTAEMESLPDDWRMIPAARIDFGPDISRLWTQ